MRKEERKLDMTHKHITKNASKHSRAFVFMPKGTEYKEDECE